MKKINIFYWVTTALFAAMMTLSAIPDIVSASAAVKGMHEGLGYPLYFIPFIGVMKLLGALAIITPGHARLKEWAYAGLCFDLVGATYSIIASGQGSQAGFMVVPLVLAALSYYFHIKRQSFATPTTARHAHSKSNVSATLA